MKKLLLTFLCCLTMCGCVNNSDASDDNYNKPNNAQQNASDKGETKTKPVLNKPFIFDDLEITISDSYTFDIIKNQFSEYNNNSVIKIPVTIKNLKDETHSLNMFYFSLFGSKGSELHRVSAFFDDSVDSAGDLRTGSSYTKYFYILYDGDGIYSIEFDNWVDKITIDINIKK